MKSFFRILKVALPKSVLFCSLTSSLKLIRLQDKLPQQNTQYLYGRNNELLRENHKIQIQNSEKKTSEESKQNTDQQKDNIQQNHKDKLQEKQIENFLKNKKESSSTAKQQKNQKKQNKEFQQNLENSSAKSSQISQQGSISISSNQQQKKQNQILKQNLAIVGQSIPNYIIKYLNSRGLKIIISKDIDKKNIILHNNQKQSRIIKILTSSTQSKDTLWEISNFLSPIKQITNLNDAKQLLKQLEKDQSIISAYIPTINQYKSQFQQKTRSIFDSFSKSFYLNVQQKEKQFKQQKYQNSSKKNQFVIIRNKQAAQYLKVNINKVGIPHILYNSYELTGNEPNCKIQTKNYTCHNLERFVKSDNYKPQKLTEKISEVTNQYICNINVKQDLIDKIRQIRQINFKKNVTNQKITSKKLLIVKLDDSKKQFQNNVHKILEKVSKLMKNQVVIVKTQNQQILRQVLHICPDDYATIRLIDLSKEALPIIPTNLRQNISIQNRKKLNNNPFYLRYVMKGPFQIQNICQFISSCELNEPYQQKNIKISNIKPFYPSEFKNFYNGALLFQKYGCNGCSLAQSLFSKIIKLQSFIKRQNHKLSNEIRLKYKIQEIELFANMNVRKYNILNQDSQYSSPQNTPKIMIYDKQGRQKDLKIDQVFNLLKDIEKGQSQQMVHDKMIQQIIQRMSKNLLQE